MVDDTLTSTMKTLGVRSYAGNEPLMLRLLKAILENKRDYETPFTSSEVLSLLGRAEPGSKPSKAAVERNLKTLVEIGLVGVKASGAQKTSYFADASTIEDGLKKLAGRVKSEITQEISLTESEMAVVSGLDCAVLAQDLVEELTGHRHRISSRLIIGMEDIRRAIKYNIGDIARESDIIRLTVLSSSPFLDERQELADEIVQAASNGAQVRCLIHSRLAGGPRSNLGFAEDGKGVKAAESGEEGKLGIEMKVYDGPNTYRAVTFGNQCMALVVLDDPATVTWITREFNPDIIDSSISVFDALWQDAKSIERMEINRSATTDRDVIEPHRQKQTTSQRDAITEEADERQTQNERTIEALRLASFDSKELRFSLLRIALENHDRLGMPIDFASIYKQITAETGKKGIHRSQVYRSLMSLENDGYIHGDRTSHPFRYDATPETLDSAFSNARNKALNGLGMRRAEITSEIERLSGLDLLRLSSDAIEIATEVPSRTSASFAEGHDQIRGLADSEVYSAARKGDIVRVSLGWMRSAPDITQTRLGTLTEVIRRGVKTRVLVSRHWVDDESTIGMLTDAYKTLLRERRDVSVKVTGTTDSTYQLAARNDEGIMLIVSDEPPAAIYVPRSVNERLVDDAITGFDTEFGKGTDFYPGPKESVRR